MHRQLVLPGSEPRPMISKFGYHNGRVAAMDLLHLRYGSPYRKKPVHVSFLHIMSLMLTDTTTH